MNAANYTATDSYPLTTEGLDFIQKQILILEQMAAAYGNGNWILQGMTDNSGILSSGVIAIVDNGTAEIVEYDGGDPSTTTKWSIQSTTTTTPNRTVKKLVANQNGTITGLKRVPMKIKTLYYSNEDAPSLRSKLLSIKVLSIGGMYTTSFETRVDGQWVSTTTNYLVIGYAGNAQLVMLNLTDNTLSTDTVPDYIPQRVGITFTGSIIYVE